MTLYPVDGGAPKPIAGVAANDRAIRFREDGSAIFTYTRGGLPSKIHRIDVNTGERKLWKELSAADPTGVEGITAVRMTPGGDCFAFSYAQRLNDLYVVEGLF